MEFYKFSSWNGFYHINGHKTRYPINDHQNVKMISEINEKYSKNNRNSVYLISFGKPYDDGNF